MVRVGTAGLVINGVDPDWILRAMVYDLGLHCLFKPVCLSSLDYICSKNVTVMNLGCI